ncbi:hypothetical protein DBV15_06425, partial [Temnothorax longispinosus]
EDTSSEERNEKPPSTPAVRFRSASPYAPRLYVSLRSPPTRRTCVAVSSSPLLFASLLSHRPPPPSPLVRSRSPTRNTTQAAPEAGNETHVWHYFRSGQSGRSAQTAARHLSAVASNPRRSAPHFAAFKYGRLR